MYQKEIIYISLYNNDIKESCVGYLKSEKKQDDFRLELQVKNVPDILSGNFPIRLQSGSEWQEADLLTIQNGYGRWTGNIGEQVLKVEIMLPNPYKISGQSKQISNMENKNKDEMDAASEQAVESQEHKIIPKEQQVSSQKQRSDLQERKPQKQSDKSELPVKAVSIAREERSDKHSKPDKVIDAPLYENKWEQILSTYEKIHPYGDERIYVKLEPKDFIVLRSNYQHLVNNSFLLHGFYNYRYLILGKEKDFYLGVPGVFYEREKMVALMFGFEAFECEGGAAEEGKFGYYLRKVEL